MKYLKSLFLSLIGKYAPSWTNNLFFKKRIQTLQKSLEGFEVRSGEKIKINSVDMRMITLSNNIKLIGHKASPAESKVFQQTASKFNLDSSFVKILLDTVTRYIYPHADVATLQMNIPKNERQLFHPQHVNFIQEEEQLSDTEKKSIEEIFKPQLGWKCMDIGSFLGHGATKLREKIGPEGKLICVEASKHNSLVIKKQMNLNSFDNVIVKFAAIWHTEKEFITFNLTHRQGNAIDNSVVKGTNTIDVPTVSIKSLTRELGQPADFVSLTVNGAEVEALEGLKKMKKSNLPKRIVAPGWYPTNGVLRSTLIESILSELGYNYVTTRGHLTIAWL